MVYSKFFRPYQKSKKDVFTKSMDRTTSAEALVKVRCPHFSIDPSRLLLSSLSGSTADHPLRRSSDSSLVIRCPLNSISFTYIYFRSMILHFKSYSGIHPILSFMMAYCISSMDVLISLRLHPLGPNSSFLVKNLRPARERTKI
jgi:hypothetical protein